MALLGVGSEAASTPICLPAFWNGGILTYSVSLVLQGLFQTPWIFACTELSAVYDLDNTEGSFLGISFDVFCLSELLAFHPPISLGVSVIVAGIFVVSACLAECYRDLLVYYSLFIAGFSEVLRWTPLRLQSMPQEVPPLPSVIIVL